MLDQTKLSDGMLTIQSSTVDGLATLVGVVQTWSRKPMARRTHREDFRRLWAQLWRKLEMLNLEHHHHPTISNDGYDLLEVLT